MVNCYVVGGRLRLAALVISTGCKTVLMAGMTSALLSSCALGPISTPHDVADEASIARVQSALDSIGGLQARFVQYGPDAGVSAGSAWFEVGHLRLAYDPPMQRIVVAANGRLTVHDEPSGATTRIALSANPLGLLLSGPVRLGGQIDVTDVQSSPGAIQVSLARASNPAQGLLTLMFLVQPDDSLLLSGLEAVDSERHRTRFVLSRQRAGLTLDPSMFMPPG